MSLSRLIEVVTYLTLSSLACPAILSQPQTCVRAAYQTTTVSSSLYIIIHVTKPSSQMRQMRNFKRMDHASFEADLISELANVDIEQGAEIVLHQYEKAMKSSMDKRAPMRTRTTQSRKREPWYNDDIHNARQLRRMHETRWIKWIFTGKSLYVHRSEVNTKHHDFESEIASL